MSAPQNIINKIASLLRRAAKGRDSDDEILQREALLAAKMAAKYMARYNIEVELDALDEGQPDSVLGERMVLFLKERGDCIWAQFLLQQLAPLYWCSNKQLEAEAGWTFYVIGPPGQVEPCAVHYEFLVRKIEMIGQHVCNSLYNPHSFFEMSQRVRDGVHWGVMDGLIQNLERKHAHKGPPDLNIEKAPEQPTVVRLEPMLALSPAEHVDVLGDEIALLGEDLSGEEPPPFDAPEPPRWAYEEGRRAVDSSENPEPPDIIFRPVSELDIPSRLAEMLLKAELHSIAQLVRLRPAQVFALEGIGETEILQLVHALGDHGLFFPPDWETEEV